MGETMEDEKIRQIVAGRLSAYRKRAKMTQAELAEKINYSDKSVSKWERGDGLPDLLVLCKLADLYEIPVDEFLHEGVLLRPKSVLRRRHLLVSMLSIGLVFLIAALVFYILTNLNVSFSWMCFVVALPISCILAVVFSHIWGSILPQFLSVSLLVWSLTVTIFLFVFLFADTLKGNGLLFAIAGGMQILVILWYLLQHYRMKSIEKGL